MMENETRITADENRYGRFARARLDRFLATRSVLTAVQPMVDLETSALMGHELLARPLDSDISSTAKRLLQIAESQGLAAELCRQLRREGLKATAGRLVPPRLFLNIHPAELSAPDELIGSLRELTEGHPEVELTVELPEQATLEMDSYIELRKRLHLLGIGVAFDGFGSGRSRLLELAAAPPDYVKFALQMVRGIDRRDEFRERVLLRVVEFIHSIGALPVAVGVETSAELSACQELGFSWAQGFLLGRPWTVAA